jgi:hypothetical protein
MTTSTTPKPPRTRTKHPHIKDLQAFTEAAFMDMEDEALIAAIAEAHQVVLRGRAVKAARVKRLNGDEHQPYPSATSGAVTAS